MVQYGMLNGMAVQPNLDHGSSIPLYRQLHEHFSSLIRSGHLAPGGRLPATRELAGMLGLNRTTITAAYQALEAEGLILRHVGRGSFVASGRSSASNGVDWDTLLSKNSSNSSAGFARGGISFANSRPSGELFPLEAVRACCEEVTRSTDLASILQLGSPSGYEPLRRRLLESARSEGVAKPADDLLITSGCQQALDLLSRVLLSADDRWPLRIPFILA